MDDEFNILEANNLFSMKVVKYNHSKHFDILFDWLSERGCFIPDPNDMPRTGFIAYKKDLPIAMAFLRYVEGGFGQLDGLTSNPKASSLQRHKAINIVVTKIIEEAKKYNLKILTATSKDAGTIMRSKSHGFVHLPDVTIALNLRDKQTLN